MYKEKLINENDYVKLARKSIEYYVENHRKLNFDQVKDEFPKEFIEEASKESAGVFVTIQSNGSLRGCIGTIQPTQENIIEEIIQNGISASNYDPRFPSIEPQELMELDISVDVLMEKEEINSIEQLDVKKYGVVVSKGGRQGLLLPNLDGVDTIEEQVDIAMQKAGIADKADMKLYRFEVIRHKT